MRTSRCALNNSSRTKKSKYRVLQHCQSITPGDRFELAHFQRAAAHALQYTQDQLLVRNLRLRQHDFLFVQQQPPAQLLGITR